MKTTTEGEKVTVETKQAFNGTNTRVLEQGIVGNIHQGRFDDSRISRPHTVLLEFDGITYPLSKFLSGNHHGDSEIHVSVDGYDRLGELDCVKLRIDSSRGNAPPHTARVIWLAVTRNFIPIRHEGFGNTHSSTLPLEVGVVTEMREISHGIWFPMSCSIKVYDETKLKNNEQVLLNTTERQTTFVELDPTIDTTLFASVEFPDGIKVYDVVGGKIVNSYVHGGVGDDKRPRSVSWQLIVTALIALGLAALTLMKAQKALFKAD